MTDGQIQRRAYVLNELENSLSVLDIGAADGTLSPVTDNKIPYEVRNINLKVSFGLLRFLRSHFY